MVMGIGKGYEDTSLSFSTCLITCLVLELSRHDMEVSRQRLDCLIHRLELRM